MAATSLPPISTQAPRIPPIRSCNCRVPRPWSPRRPSVDQFLALHNHRWVEHSRRIWPFKRDDESFAIRAVSNCDLPNGNGLDHDLPLWRMKLYHEIDSLPIRSVLVAYSEPMATYEAAFESLIAVLNTYPNNSLTVFPGFPPSLVRRCSACNGVRDYFRLPQESDREYSPWCCPTCKDLDEKRVARIEVRGGENVPVQLNYTLQHRESPGMQESFELRWGRLQR